MKPLQVIANHGIHRQEFVTFMYLHMQIAFTLVLIVGVMSLCLEKNN